MKRIPTPSWVGRSYFTLPWCRARTVSFAEYSALPLATSISREKVTSAPGDRCRVPTVPKQWRNRLAVCWNLSSCTIPDLFSLAHLPLNIHQPSSQLHACLRRNDSDPRWFIDDIFIVARGWVGALCALSEAQAQKYLSPLANSPFLRSPT